MLGVLRAHEVDKMPYYRLIFEHYVFDVDYVYYFFVGIVSFLVAFFLLRDFFRERKKDFSGPTGKMIAGTICALSGLLHTGLFLFVLSLF